MIEALERLGCAFEQRAEPEIDAVYLYTAPREGTSVEFCFSTRDRYGDPFFEQPLLRKLISTKYHAGECG